MQHGRAIAREDGYLPVRDYAAIGDDRTVALVGLDGSVDWLCLPDLDSPSVFGALLDAENGGSFQLAPQDPFRASRRYVDDSNVLETIFETADGAVKVTDAFALPPSKRSAKRELVRRVEGLAGLVTMRWHARPRFGYGRAATRLEQRNGEVHARGEGASVLFSSRDAGTPTIDGDVIDARFELAEGQSALVILTADDDPKAPGREEAENGLEHAERFWREWAGNCMYDGPFRDAVIRSALTLKLLVHAPSGAIAAAPTTSLPEVPGGERNWDYRHCWIRDSSFVVDTLLELGSHEVPTDFLAWVQRACAPTSPRLNVLYALDGSQAPDESQLSLPGYRGAQPVRIGNSASQQLQLGIYGDLLESAWLHSRSGGALTADESKRYTEIADLVCEIWREKDAGIWETRRDPEHLTHSKAMCWVALDRACRLADGGRIRGDTERWRACASEIREYVDEFCWSEEKQTYTRAAGSQALDASILLGALFGYCGDDRMRPTIEAVRSELGAGGPLLYRYLIDDDLEGREGAFLACSFWLAGALAATGQTDEAGELLDELIGLANDVGLYSEEIDPGTGDFLGNFPLALTHLSLISAALALQRDSER
jgi:GH15 family glucan-1,4-alpha-glucosidase